MEDDPEAGAMAIAECDVGPLDTVVGISASGRTPYVVGALHRAGQRGAATVAVVNNRPSDMERVAGITIAPITGPEVLSGSTRLKAGTSQKMVLNMLTTGAMMELGKTYAAHGDVHASNNKLKARALRIVRQVTGAIDCGIGCARRRRRQRKACHSPDREQAGRYRGARASGKEPGLPARRAVRRPRIEPG